jgi:hypothetical protein
MRNRVGALELTQISAGPTRGVKNDNPKLREDPLNKLITLAVATVLIALAPAANATVVWTFYETGCTT